MKQVSTRFMEGYKGSEMFDILAENFGMSEICSCGIDFEEAIFSRGFVNAVESGKMPILDSLTESYKMKRNEEYHHIIIDDECYVMYFYM